jgi:hypothetical protein
LKLDDADDDTAMTPTAIMSGRGVASVGRRAAVELPAVLRLQLDAVRVGAPSECRLPMRIPGRCDAQQQPVFTDDDGLAGSGHPACQAEAVPGAGAGEGLRGGRGHCDHDRSPVGIGRNQAAAMIGVEGAKAAPTQPGRLGRVDKGDSQPRQILIQRGFCGGHFDTGFDERRGMVLP